MNLKGCRHHCFFTHMIIMLMITMIHLNFTEAFCGEHKSYIEYFSDGSSLTDKWNDTSLFQQNLYSTLNNLSSEEKISIYRFSSSETGEGPNAAYATASCIGDSNYYDCLACIQRAISCIKEDCSNITHIAIIWYGGCVVRYSNHPLRGVVSVGDVMLQVWDCNTNMETMYARQFDKARAKLFTKLAKEAVTRANGFTMFASGSISDGPSNQTIYGAAQCTPELYSQQCSACLSIICKKLEESCSGKNGGSVVGPTCNFRYEVYRFINESPLHGYSFLESSLPVLSPVELESPLPIALAPDYPSPLVLNSPSHEVPESPALSDSPAPQVPDPPSPVEPEPPSPELPDTPLPEVPSSPSPEGSNTPVTQAPDPPSPDVPDSPSTEVPKSPSPEGPELPSPEVPHSPSPTSNLPEPSPTVPSSQKPAPTPKSAKPPSILPNSTIKPPSPTDERPPSSEGPDRSRTAIIIAISVGIPVIMIGKIILIVMYILKRKRRRRSQTTDQTLSTHADESGRGDGNIYVQYNIDTINNNTSKADKLGQVGGKGTG